tara:strand:- start:469 stop:1530 length:1062 start_codon:yes stop_codon:yes gene_type:complete
MRFPLILKSNDVLSVSQYSAVFNGYLVDENYFAGCGGGGNSSSASAVDSAMVAGMIANAGLGGSFGTPITNIQQNINNFTEALEDGLVGGLINCGSQGAFGVWDDTTSNSLYSYNESNIKSTFLMPVKKGQFWKSSNYCVNVSFFMPLESGVDSSSSFNSIPRGANVGEILFWDGNDWVGLATPANGASLTFCNGTPYWGECYEIGGLGPAGGYVFYVDGNGGGLEAFPDDIFSTTWGCSNTLLGNTGTNIGDGLLNTNNIAANCPIYNYALNCLMYSVNGFSDWYMPSKDELNLIYTNLHSTAISGSTFQGYYISSSEYSSTKAWIQSFINGSQYGFSKTGTSISTIPIRTF